MSFDSNAVAKKIVQDYDFLWGEQLKRMHAEVGQPISWAMLGAVNKIMLPALSAGIESALNGALAENPLPTPIVPDETSQPDLVEPPTTSKISAVVKKTFKGSFQARPVPPTEELMSKILEMGDKASISGLAKAYASKSGTVKKWLAKRGIIWATGAAPVVMDMGNEAA